jgi:hypothetical protein
MRSRSITFRLVAWYAGISLLVCLSFGLYTYFGLSYYVTAAQRDTLRRRARQVAALLRAHVNREGEAFTIELIKTAMHPPTTIASFGFAARMAPSFIVRVRQSIIASIHLRCSHCPRRWRRRSLGGTP